MPSKRVTVKFSETEHALCSRAAEPSYLSNWLHELAVREAKSQLASLADDEALREHGLEDLKIVVAEVRAKLSDRANAAEALATFDRFCAMAFRVMDLHERAKKMLASAEKMMDQTGSDDVR